MDVKVFLACFLLAVGNLMIGIYTGANKERGKYQNQAIEHGCARYHPQTGKFEWIKKGAEND